MQLLWPFILVFLTDPFVKSMKRVSSPMHRTAPPALQRPSNGPAASQQVASSSAAAAHLPQEGCTRPQDAWNADYRGLVLHFVELPQ